MRLRFFIFMAMSQIDLLFSLLLTGAVFVLAGFVKGVVGLGLPTITMGLLSLAMPPAQAAALLVVPSLVTNLWQIAARPGLWALARRIATLLLGVCAGVWAGAGWLSGGSGGGVVAGLGLALMAYATLGLVSVRIVVAPRHERWASPLVGVATGLVTAATGVFVIPAVPYLQALGLEKEELVQALGISFLVSTVALAMSLNHGGSLQGATLAASLLALLPALAGMGLGQRLRRRVQPERFKRIFFGSLLALGAWLLVHSLASI
jgi:uncharacterized membrane protein YfcA